MTQATISGESRGGSTHAASAPLIDLAHSSVGSRMVIVHHVMPGWRWRRCDNGVDAAQGCQ